jgi:hypothetical protein
MLSGLGAVWQSFLGFAVYDVLGKIRIPCPALTSLLRQRHFSKRNNVVMPEIRSYRTDTRVRVACDFRLSHRITNERSTFAVFSRLSLTRIPSPFSFLPCISKCGSVFVDVENSENLLGIAEQHSRHAAVDCRPNGARPCGSAQAKQEAKRGVTHARGWLGDYANRTYTSPHPRSRLT